MSSALIGNWQEIGRLGSADCPEKRGSWPRHIPIPPSNCSAPLTWDVCPPVRQVCLFVCLLFVYLFVCLFLFGLVWFGLVLVALARIPRILTRLHANVVVAIHSNLKLINHYILQIDICIQNGCSPPSITGLGLVFSPLYHLWSSWYQTTYHLYCSRWFSEYYIIISDKQKNVCNLFV